MLIFDIGFNVGKFSFAQLEKYPEARIIGVEANLELSNKWRKFCLIAAMHDIVENITVINYIVCEKDNETREFYCSNENGISTASKNWMEESRFTKGNKYIENKSIWPTKITVPTITLDSLINYYGSPDLIKIDVEGYELEILKGLSNKQKKICFEWVEEMPNLLEKCVHRLKHIGYTEFGVAGYLDEGDIFPGITYDPQGDSYTLEPKEYFSWSILKPMLFKAILPKRGVNYGMFFCR